MNALSITFIACSIAALLSVIYSKCKTRKLIKHMENQVEKSLILKEMLEIELAYIKLKNDECTREELDHLKKVDKYLNDNTDLLNKMCYEIDLSKIIIQESSIEDKEFRKLMNEFQRCSDSIRELIKRKQQVTIRVVKLKRPRYYALSSMRNKVFFHMFIHSFDILVSILEGISNVSRVTGSINHTINRIINKKETWQHSEKIIHRSDSILST